MIEVQHLTKQYGRVTAVNDVSFRVEKGEIVGFLGPNGAGKSTTIRILLDLIRPSAGHASVLGLDCQAESRRVRAAVGYLAGDVRLYGGMRGHEVVELVGAMRDHRVDDGYINALAADLDLDLHGHAGSYSKGNRQKLGILLALLSRPPVLLLDEPTAGLDPIVQRVVWQILQREAARGTAVFFSSHVLSEVDQVCDRVGILREGRLVAVETVANLKGRAVRHVEMSFAGALPADGALDLDGVRELRRTGETIEVEVQGEVDGLIKAIAPYHVTDLRTEQPTLDEVLLAFYRQEAAR